MPRKLIEGRARCRQCFFVQWRSDHGGNFFAKRGLRSPHHTLPCKPACLSMDFSVGQLRRQCRNLQNRNDAHRQILRLRWLLNHLQFELKPFWIYQVDCFLHRLCITRHKTSLRDRPVFGRQRIVQERTRNDFRANAARISWRDSDGGQCRHKWFG